MASNENLDSISIAGSHASWIAELTRQEVIAELCNMGVGFNTKDSIERLRRRLHRAILDEEDRKEEEQENSPVPNPLKVSEVQQTSTNALDLSGIMRILAEERAEECRREKRHEEERHIEKERREEERRIENECREEERRI